MQLKDINHVLNDHSIYSTQTCAPPEYNMAIYFDCIGMQANTLNILTCNDSMPIYGTYRSSSLHSSIWGLAGFE